jgi:hypothetical protein
MRRSYGTRLLLSRWLTDVSRSEHPAVPAAAIITTVKTCPAAHTARHRCTRFMAGIVRTEARASILPLKDVDCFIFGYYLEQDQVLA